jgi:hypothetical protein
MANGTNERGQHVKMITLNVPNIQGDKQEQVYNVYDFPYDTFELPTVNKKKVTYYNCSCAFDIEATTIPPKNETERAFAFMYQWQFCLIDTVVFGRTWEEFALLLDKLRQQFNLNNENILVIYVHNLAYEFQFMKDFLQINSMFCKDKRKPMKMLCDGIEFRCSYFLSNMSLAKFCENSQGCMHYKLTDTYDYKKLRFPNTTLTEEEQGYCYNDVRGLCECIDTMLENDTIISIPLTNTGYVRREYRKAMKTNNKNRAKFVETALTPEQYKMCKDAFRGGNTHANRFMSGLMLDNVWSYDIQSSYPSSISMDDYPIGKFIDVTLDNQMKLDYYCDNYCVVMQVEFYNIDLNNDEVIPYIDIAHCKEKSHVVNDNGRVLKADYIKLTLTNIDLDIIRKTYHYDGFVVLKAICASKGKLPAELRQKMMEFYTAKTELKDVTGKEYEYMKSKNRVNATFGMMVTAIDHTEVEYDCKTMEWEEIEPNIAESLEAFYKNRNNFLSYQWGIFVTANARKRLQRMLDVVKEDVVYIDTDSIKFVNEKHIAEFESLNDELIKMAENNDIQAYATKDGVKYFLGIWDKDGTYKRFKTLGAKKYCVDQYNKDGILEFKITVSGMHKKKGAKAIARMENFLIGKTFHDIGRTTSFYNDIEPHKLNMNGCSFTTASNIGILDTTYKLGVTNEYLELISPNFDMDIESY